MKLKGYRTLIFNFIISILPVLETLDVTNILNPKAAAYYMLFVTLGNAILRFYTNTPVGDKNARTP